MNAIVKRTISPATHTQAKTHNNQHKTQRTNHANKNNIYIKHVQHTIKQQTRTQQTRTQHITHNKHNNEQHCQQYIHI